MDWITTVNGLIALITALLGLVGTGIGAFLTIKSWITATKEKSSQEIWSMIMSVADSAMKEAEASGKTGVDKKQMVVNIVKSACKSAGIEIDLFIDQLSDYIDQTIDFVNGMKK